MLEIYTDGACSGNPGPGGWAAIVVENDKVINAMSGRFDNTTNNRMELTAIIWALTEYGMGEPYADAVIFSDSAYCVNMYNDWIDGWGKNGWVRSKGKPIENLDLVKQMHALKWMSGTLDTSEGYTNDKIKLIESGITVKKVAGHSGIKYNELADQLATAKITVEEVLKQDD